MLVIRENMIDLYSGFLKNLIYLLIHLQKKKLRAKVAFHELFSTCNDRDAVFYKDFTYGAKRCQSLRDISFNK